jgi:phosphoglycolate phosphatase-like HAD superfamily hydrolase
MVASNIDLIVLDFDGTVTNVPPSVDHYLTAYGGLVSQWLAQHGTGKWAKVGVTQTEWQETCELVQSWGPSIGWSLATTAAAPVGADPYILAGEAATVIALRRDIATTVPYDLYSSAYSFSPADWRPEAAEALGKLMDCGAQLAFVSNASADKIEANLDRLLGHYWRGRISVKGGSGKFRIDELLHERHPKASPLLSPDLRARFSALPSSAAGPGRPIYLRRGTYFTILSSLWHGDASRIERTIVCGDVWELDLAMPAALGAQVHLIERGAPFPAYPYELEAADAVGSRSPDLRGLLSRLGI